MGKILVSHKVHIHTYEAITTHRMMSYYDAIQCHMINGSKQGTKHRHRQTERHKSVKEEFVFENDHLHKVSL